MSNGNNSTNTYAYDDKSVETLFGLSKGMVHLFSRVVRLLSRVGRLGRFLNEKEVDAYGTTVPAEKEKEKEQTADNSIAFSVEALNADAAAVQRDMDSWIASLRSPTLEQADEHERVHSGNAAYAHALRLLLLRQIYGRPRSDPDVQSSAQHALQHCSSSAAAGMGIDLMWPAILGACELGTISKEHSEGHEHRLWVKALLEGFRAQCCFDVDVAQRIVAEVWRRDDKGEKGADWKSVCKDLGLKVLLC
jgi:hypothetical protein